MTPTVDRRSAARVARRGARLALFAVIVASPFRGRWVLVARPTTPLYSEFTDVVVSAADIALICLVVLWLVSVVLERRRVAVGPRFVVWPVAVLLVVIVVGIPFSADAVVSASTTVRMVLAVALAVYVVDQVAGIDQLVIPIAVMVAVQAVVGIGQVVGQHSLSLGWLGEHLLRPELGVSVVTTGDGTRVLRAYGLTDHPNILGGLLTFAILLLMAAVAARRTHRPIDQLLLVVLAMAGACLFVTFSRGAWVGAAVGLIVLFVMLMVAGAPRRMATGGAWVAALAIGLGAAPFIAPYHDVVSARTDRSSTISTEVRSIDEREVLTRATRHIVNDHRLIGVGLGALSLAMRDAEPDFRYDYQPAPSVVLDVAAETGLVGGLAYAVLLVAPWVAVVRARRRWTPQLAGASAALAAVTIVGLFDYYTWTYTAGRIWMWLVLGVWVGAYQRATSVVADV